jgi:hypothetical protein
MAPVAFYDSAFVKKSNFYPIAIALQISYNTNIEYFGRRDLPAYQQGRSFYLPKELYNSFIFSCSRHRLARSVPCSGTGGDY